MSRSIFILMLVMIIAANFPGEEARAQVKQQSLVSDVFSGSYTAKGFRPGEPYTVEPTYVITCDIAKKGDYYVVRWYEKGQLAYYGLGIHIDHILAVSYLSTDNSIYGTVSYKDYREEKGYLVGAWCIAAAHPDALGNGSNGMEVLWPVE